ncbi:N-terminal acetyltransferase A complex subunit nat1 [Xylona heveae TC161]|uniref:N-terminal acetyltransferase A complex subunit nat1 n=1 Tax=Xylona heveae (strain CBS 132557 / TC161) TaxID=1328760 RepID=A0A165GK24_XYLHT|nr:N-terminal acetyltransferase A complex subunit nat1 [Xylona heveae TC161]KZF22288.1 N-terminal acetyltransferase A complex subunit nat1 [Xylona heveae TC161]
MPQILSPKDASLFRQVIKHYDAKQYKKGIKTAEQILRKNPQHGDTLAMKALILNAQGKNDEAFPLAKEALRNDMKSHVCWHVYGLLWRAEKNFEEAIKAYKFALRLEPESPQIQRDLALLQMQMRDFQGYATSRRAMLQARPQIRSNWTAMAIAHHLAGEYTEAEKVLTTYEETLKSPPSKTDVEHSEAVLYKNTIIAESGDLERALKHLESISKTNLDKTAVMEMRADYLLRLDRKSEAEKAYRELLDRNADYRPYYDGLEKALGLDKNKDKQALKELYDEYAKNNPRGDAPKRVPLDFLEGDDFRDAATQYLHYKLSKGVPSCFVNIKSLYTDDFKKNTIQDIVEGFANGKGVRETNGSVEDKSEEDANAFKSAVLYFLAQHYNYYLSRDLQKATSYIDQAIELSPKSVDFHMTKARIWKHYGNTQKASETMEQARTLDVKDRYINTKAAKYQLRNDENEAALKNMSKFTRNETVGGPLGDLIDMQCMWYLLEDGESYLRQQKFGLALKRFKTIHDIFDVWQEDQFDFHSFSLRKGEIRAYVDMLRWEDTVRSHPFYSRAALSAIKAYTLLHDHPKLVNGPLLDGVDGDDAEADNADAAERKKAQKKAKKEQQRLEAEKEAAKKQQQQQKSTAGADGETKKEDPDPQGTTLVQTKEPLKDAEKFLNHLLEFSPKIIRAQTAGFEVYIRLGKYLLALKCLIAASKLDSQDPVLHEQIIRFRKTLDSLSEPLPPQVSSVIDAELPTLLPKDTDLAKFNEQFLARHAQSAAHMQAALQARRVLNPDAKADIEKSLSDTLALPNITLEQAQEGLATLKSWAADKTKREAYVQAAAKRWPEASAFQSA